MSTKIHHGFRLTAGIDVFEFAVRLRSVMNPIRDRLDAALLMTAATLKVDNADINGDPRPARLLTDAYMEHDEHQRTMNPNERGHDPHRFEVTFLRDAETSRILALLYTDHRDFEHAWEALPDVEPYGYWDNTDQPDDVTDAEWGERRAVWDRTLGYEPPVMKGLGFSLRSTMDLGLLRMASSSRGTEDEALLREMAPTKVRRAERIAQRLLIEAHLAYEPDADVLDVTWRHLRHPDPATVAAVAVVLHDDITDYLLAPSAEPMTRPVDLTHARSAAEAAVTTLLTGVDP